MKDRILILVRHAHRDTDKGRDRDNGLSDRGKVQAKSVARFFLERFDVATPVLLSSPKIRCIETLLPLSDKLGVEVQVVDLLKEQAGTQKEFDRQIEKFFRWWKQRAPETVVVCSHGDWIPRFAKKVFGLEIELKKGGWMEVESSGGAIRLRWLLQKLPR